MRIRGAASFWFVSLLVVTTACSKSETGTQSDRPPEGADQPLVDQVERGGATSTDQALPTARSETCEPRGELEERIRAAEKHLAELRLQYTDRHPDVIATRSELDALERRSLDECVERLQ